MDINTAVVQLYERGIQYPHPLATLELDALETDKRGTPDSDAHRTQ